VYLHFWRISDDDDDDDDDDEFAVCHACAINECD